MRSDVIVAGGGPAGALTALILARAGVRVRVFDRARFPRPKLCGDTVNPGAVRLLGRYVSLDRVRARALPLAGMRLTGPGVSVAGRYEDRSVGLAITRRVLDMLLVEEAARAGVDVIEETTVVAPITDGAGVVTGVIGKAATGLRREYEARLVIAADGRESRLARALGLTYHPLRPRRWAIGGYFDGVAGMSDHGEMHVRPTHYIGVAPVPDGLTNVCLVVPHRGGDTIPWREPALALTRALEADPALASRFAGAQLVEAPQVLGPMAVDARTSGAAGILLAGDAAGFIDPITGDGLRFAIAGAALAAEVALDALAGYGDPRSAHVALAARRRQAFGGKWRFNRGVRLLVASAGGVRSAAVAARMLPRVFEGVIRYAGDCAPTR